MSPLFKYLTSHKRSAQILLLGLAIGSGLLTLVPIEASRHIIDEVLLSGNKTQLSFYIAVMALAVLVRFAVDYIQSLVAKKIQLFFIADLRARIVRKILSVSSDFAKSNPVGTLQNRILHDVARFGMGVEWIFVKPLISIVSFIIYALFLMQISLEMFLFSLLPVPVFLLFVPKINANLEGYRRDIGTSQGAYAAGLTEVLLSTDEVKKHGKLEYETSRMETLHLKLEETFLSETRALTKITIFSLLTGQIGLVIVYWVGGLFVIDEGLTIGQIVAFSGALIPLYFSIDSLIQSWPVYRNVAGRYGELTKILDWEQDEISNSMRIENSSGSEPAGIRLTDVSVENNEGDRILSQINLFIPGGEKVAIVGPSGCGKSTLVNVIGRMRSFHSGHVNYVGLHEQANVRPAQVFGFISQTPFIYSGTILYNFLYRFEASEVQPLQESVLLQLIEDCAFANDMIDFGLQQDDISINLDQLKASFYDHLVNEIHVIDAETQAELFTEIDSPQLLSGYDFLLLDALESRLGPMARKHMIDFVAMSPWRKDIIKAGLDFNVGENGNRLSGGQRQKISIIRVLITTPAVIIADEITSALDERSSEAVMRTLTDPSLSSMVLSITHDLSLLDHYDRTLVMKKGTLSRDLSRGQFDSISMD